VDVFVDVGVDVGVGDRDPLDISSHRVASSRFHP